jgi:hypothetical protein
VDQKERCRQREADAGRHENGECGESEDGHHDPGADEVNALRALLLWVVVLCRNVSCISTMYVSSTSKNTAAYAV